MPRPIKRGGGDPSSDPTEVVDPLPYSQAYNIEHHQNSQQRQRD